MTKNVFILIAAIIGCNCTSTNNRPSSFNVRQALKRKIEQRSTYIMRAEHPDRTIALKNSGQDIDVNRDTNVNSDNSDEIEIVYDAKRSAICNKAKRRRRRAIPTDEALKARSMGLASTFDAGINEDQCLDDNNSHSILFSTLLANKAASLIRCKNSPRNNLSKDALYQAQQDCITNNNVAKNLEIQKKHSTPHGCIQKTRSSMDEALSANKGIDNGVYSNVAGNTRVDGYIFNKSDPIGTIAVILSFASLNIYKEIFKPNVHRNAILEKNISALPINNMNVDEANEFVWQQTRSDYRFYFMIKFIDKKFLLPDFERKDLYLTIDNTCYWFLPQIDKALQFQESIERFIGSYEDDKNITYQQIQELYLSFIAYICFEYHEKLRCRVLKEELWGMHRYMSEFYFYIMWKLEDIFTAYKFVIGQEKEFKLHLINEMEYILMMLKIYRDINEAEKSVRDVLVGKLFYVICEYRKEIRRYLKIFDKPNSLQVLYFLIDVYVNNSDIEEQLSTIANSINPCTDVSGHSQLNCKTERSKSRAMMILLEDERYLHLFGAYQKQYNIKAGKIAVALLAFIISPEEYVVNSLTVDTILNIIRKTKTSASNLLYHRIIESSTNNQKFTDSVRDLFRFLYFIRINKCSTSKSVDLESEREIKLTQRTLVAWIYDNKFEVNLDTIERIHKCMLRAMDLPIE